MFAAWFLIWNTRVSVTVVPGLIIHMLAAATFDQIRELQSKYETTYSICRIRWLTEQTARISTGSKRLRPDWCMMQDCGF